MIKYTLIHSLGDLFLDKDYKFSFISPKKQKSLIHELQIVLECYHNKQFSIKENRVIKDHLWHLFSFNVIQTKEGETAIEHFNNLYIDNLVILSTNPKIYSLNVYSEFHVLEKCELLNSALRSESKLHDIYVFHPDFKWLYVITHEEDFGPYFLRFSKV